MGQGKSKVPESKTIKANGVEFKMIGIEGGTFTLGTSREKDEYCFTAEMPAHEVTLSSYLMAETEVTQQLWEAVMGSNPSHFIGKDLPVESVSWEDCQQFIAKLNASTGMTFRLPTEAEWEYAARGGKQSKGTLYSGSNDPTAVAWGKWGGDTTHPVRSKMANELGLYDMTGNVYEWCSDWFADYPSQSQTNPKGPAEGKLHVYRGGSWTNSNRYSRLTYRCTGNPKNKTCSLGFRLAQSVK